MSLLCRLFDHKRSSSRASFDEVNQCWVSECKRCLAILVREGPGDWREAGPEPQSAAKAIAGVLHSARFTIARDIRCFASPPPGTLRSLRFTIVSDSSQPV